MGWNGTYTTENVHTAKGVTEFFRKYHFSDKCKIIASNCKNNVWYGAIEFEGAVQKSYYSIATLNGF